VTLRLVPSLVHPPDHPGYPDACGWCERLVYPDKQLRVSFGRFCSDECATNYEADLSAHLESSAERRATGQQRAAGE
jgi:hypothetical protein